VVEYRIMLVEIKAMHAIFAIMRAIILDAVPVFMLDAIL
jgi:hypothetical protein